jgi:isopenicillin N synthase-like dioxygenase
VADQKESLQVTARAGVMEGRWPSPDFERKAQALLTAANTLAGQILDLLEPRAVPTNAAGTISKSHTLWADDGQCTLRFLHYPPVAPETTKQLLADGYWRAGPHTDWANVTLLFQRPGQAGLECCANPRTGDPTDMYWTAVNPVQGGIAVNIGDMLARWSDGKMHSNLHRVRLPVDASQPRYSMAFFAQSDKKTLIESKENAPITAGDYILSRLNSNFSKKP